MEVSVDAFWVRRHKREELWRNGSLVALNRDFLGEDEFEVESHFILRVIQTEKHLRVNRNLILQRLVQHIAQSLLAKTTHEEVLDDRAAV